MTLVMLYGDQVSRNTYTMIGAVEVDDETKYPALDAWKALSLGEAVEVEFDAIGDKSENGITYMFKVKVDCRYVVAAELR